MLKINIDDDGIIHLHGRLDASQSEEATKALSKITASAIVDFKDLEYISSAGLGVLIGVQKRLKETGHGLTLRNMNNHIRDVFRYARFDLIFKIE